MQIFTENNRTQFVGAKQLMGDEGLYLLNCKTKSFFVIHVQSL